MEQKYNENYVRLGKNIAYYRKKKYLTQEGLAMKANISRGFISQIEAQNCDKAPSLDIIFRIAEVLNVEPYKLLMPYEGE